jgi:spore germination protein (amino acid permease)
MKQGETVKEALLFNAFFLMFIIVDIQTGVGIAGVQRVIYLESKHDAWISILMAGMAVHVVLWLMINTLKKYNGQDLYDIHRDLYGKWAGAFMNVLFLLYMTAVLLSIILAYSEIVQGWMFDSMPTWLISLVLVGLTVKGTLSGIRGIVGFCFFAFFLTIWLLFFLYEPLRYANWNYLQPVMEASPKELFNGALKTSFTLLGFEIIYFVYPFVKEKNKVFSYAMIGAGLTNFLVLIVTVVSIGYFSGPQLEKTIWATLSMFKIVRLPMLERFEYIAVPVWMLMIMPNLLLYMWAVTRGVKKTFGITQKKALYMVAVFLLFVSLLFKKRTDINLFIDQVGRVGLYTVFMYPILLFFFVLLKKWNEQRTRQKG